MNQPTCQKNPDTQQLLKERMATLKHNLEKVPLEHLKSKYKKAYDRLCAELKELTITYIKDISLNKLRIRKELLPEATVIIQKAISDSRILKKCSGAVFKRQDFDELKLYAEQLQKTILHALQPFYEAHICLYILPECLEEPYPPPYIYNYATGYFFLEDQWVDKPDMPGGLLLFVRKKKPSLENEPLQEAPQKTA